ncbi:MAG: hypothetical protein AB1896_17545 [Thermodesulfobacteriota bacterium]
MKREVEYFEKAGPENTGACLEIMAGLTGEGVQDFVVASTSGRTGVLAAEALSGREVNLVVVGHSVGFKGPNQDEFVAENEARIKALGGRVYRGTILTHSLETGLAGSFGGAYPTQIIAASLRRLGQGIKVACEIVMEACDAGLVAEGREVAAAAGTARGADTVALLRAKPSKRFLELVVLEILAKPRG